MTKTQGWILILILLATVALGVFSYISYSKSQSSAKAEMVAACLNQCNFQGGEPKDNACVLTCTQEKGISI